MALDRAIGALCVGAVAVAASVGLVAGASTPPPEREVEAAEPADELGPVDDPATHAAFLDLRDRSERSPRVLEAQWERRVAGEVMMTSPWREVRDGTGNELIEAFGNLTGVHDGTAITCGVVEVEEAPAAQEDGEVPGEAPTDESDSREPPPVSEEAEPGEAGDAETEEEGEAEVDPLELLARIGGFAGCETARVLDPEAEHARERATIEAAIAEGTGNYTVQRAPGRRLLGADTECFVLRRRGDAGWIFGEQTTICWSEDATPMLVERREGDVVDTRRTTSVRSEVTEADFADMLASRQDALAAADLRSVP